MGVENKVCFTVEEYTTTLELLQTYPQLWFVQDKMLAFAGDELYGMHNIVVLYNLTDVVGLHMLKTGVVYPLLLPIGGLDRPSQIVEEVVSWRRSTGISVMVSPNMSLPDIGLFKFCNWQSAVGYSLYVRWRASPTEERVVMIPDVAEYCGFSNKNISVMTGPVYIPIS